MTNKIKEELKEQILDLDFITDKEDVRVHYVKICDVFDVIDKVYKSCYCEKCEFFINAIKSERLGYCLLFDRTLPFDFSCNRFERRNNG